MEKHSLQLPEVMFPALPAGLAELTHVVKLFTENESEQEKNILEEERAETVVSGKTINMPWGVLDFP